MGAHVGFHYRYGLHMPSFLSVLKLGEYYNLPRAMTNWGRFQPTMTKIRSYLQGIGRHTESEIWEMSFKDLRAISQLLGAKEFFFGGSPTTLDCVLFGHPCSIPLHRCRVPTEDLYGAQLSKL